MSQVNSKTSALDLDHQDQISLQTIFVKKLTVFHYTFKLKLCIAHLLVQSRGGESCFCSGYLLGMDHLIPGGVGSYGFSSFFIHFCSSPSLTYNFFRPDQMQTFLFLSGQATIFFAIYSIWFSAQHFQFWRCQHIYLNFLP